MKDFTKITQNKTYCVLSVFVKRPLDRFKEKSLEALAKNFDGITNGSGYNLITKERDYSFCFRNKIKAQQFSTRAFKAGLIKSKVSLQDAFLDWEFSNYKKVKYDKII